MAHISRAFGKPLPIKPLIERGEEFFDAINAVDIERVLERSKRISNIAFTAAQIAGETLQLEGDRSGKQLVFAAYLGIGDISARVIADTNPDEAERLLTSDQTHSTLLFASKTLRSYAFDKMAKKYHQQGDGFYLNDEGLVLQKNLSILDINKGRGCPYAMGNIAKAEYFNTCTDAIVKTYTQAYRQHMPKNIVEQFIKRR